MTIYAEYLFIENFIAGLAILYITSVITGIRLKGALLVAGGAVTAILYLGGG